MPGTSKQNNKLRKRRGISRVALVGIVADVAVCLFAGLFTWIVSKPAFTVSNELDVGLRQVLKGELALTNSIAAQHKIEELEFFIH